MKLLDLIHPRFGAISICDVFIGAPRKEWALDDYDKDGRTKMDANYHLYADLELEDHGFNKGIVRLEFVNDDETISSIFLSVGFRDAVSLNKSNFRFLHDYLAQSDLFDTCSMDADDWTFRNGVNEIHVEMFEDSFSLEVYAPSASGIEPGKHYETGVLRTVAGLGSDEQDDWDEFLMEAKSRPAFDIDSFASRTVMLTYGREGDEYPCLWLILTEAELKANPEATASELTPDLLRMIVEKAGMKWEYWTEGMILSLLQGPTGQEPMELLEVEDGEGAKPMTELQLERTLNAIEFLDRERMEEPREWDKTPIG